MTDSENTFREVLERLDAHTCTLEVNGNKDADGIGIGNKVLGHPLNALCWLVNNIGKRGEILKRGDIISTGVCIDKLILLKPGDVVSVNYGSLGKVTFKCTQYIKYPLTSASHFF